MAFKKKNYPPDWPKRRARVMARANNCCEMCGVKQYTVGYRTGPEKNLVSLIVGETYKEANDLRHRMQRTMGRKLIVIRITVAHLDHDEWNNDVKDDRLAALCEKNHLDYDRVDNAKRKKYGKQYKRHQLELI